MSGLSFCLVNNVTAPHTGKSRKMKLSQKAGWISVPYLPVKRREGEQFPASTHTRRQIKSMIRPQNSPSASEAPAVFILWHQHTVRALRILMFWAVTWGVWLQTGRGGSHLSRFQQWTHSCWRRGSRPRTNPGYGTLSCHREQQRSNSTKQILCNLELIKVSCTGRKLTSSSSYMPHGVLVLD